MLDIGLAMPVKIRIECHMPDRRRRDLDNLQKAAFDALTKAGFWLDDAQVVDYRVVKMPVTKGGRLELTITEMGNELCLSLIWQNFFATAGGVCAYIVSPVLF